MLFKRLFILVYIIVLITFLSATKWSRLCDRMTSCDLVRFVRTHKKQITTVNEKTKRVDFLTNELDTGGKDLMQRIDILESKYQNLSEQISSFYVPYSTESRFEFKIEQTGATTVKLNGLMKHDFDNLLEVRAIGNVPNDANGDYEQSIAALNQVQLQLLDNFIAVENEFENLKEKVSSSLIGAKDQAYELQNIRETVNREEDTLRSLGTILKHHFEELELIRGFQFRNDNNTNVSLDLDLNEIGEQYSELESQIGELTSKVESKEISWDADCQETNDNMRFARDELTALKLSMSILVKTVNDTHNVCVNEGVELASKIRELQIRIRILSGSNSSCD